eukprot:Opistho-2@48760
MCTVHPLGICAANSRRLSRVVVAVLFLVAIVPASFPGADAAAVINGTTATNGTSAVPLPSRDYIIGSFNIQVFGVTKMSKPEVVAALLKILPLYDMLLVMEIRDATNTSIYSLLNQLNNRTAPASRYSILLSDRLGRSSSKEQYAYFYRNRLFTPVLSQIYVFNVTL